MPAVKPVSQNAEAERKQSGGAAARPERDAAAERGRESGFAPELVAETRQVVERKRSLQSLLESAQEKKNDVKPAIFEKVSADYRNRLEQVERELAPLRQRLLARLAEQRREEESLREDRELLEDDLEELRFRCEIGELSAEQREQAEGEKKQRLEHLDARLETIEQSYAVARELIGDAVDEALLESPAERAHASSSAVSPPAPSPEQPLAKTAPLTGRARRRQARAQGGSEAGSEVEAGADRPPRAPGAHTKAMPAMEASTPPPIPPLPSPPGFGDSSGSPAGGPGEPRAPEGDVDLGTASLARAFLQPKQPADAPAVALNEDPLVIGRSAMSDFVIDGPTVSRRHAIVRYEDGNYTIEDVSSGGGMLVNGEPVRHRLLVAGDEIVIGATLLEFRF